MRSARVVSSVTSRMLRGRARSESVSIPRIRWDCSVLNAAAASTTATTARSARFIHPPESAPLRSLALLRPANPDERGCRGRGIRAAKLHAAFVTLGGFRAIRFGADPSEQLLVVAARTVVAQLVPATQIQPAQGIAGRGCCGVRKGCNCLGQRGAAHE